MIQCQKILVFFARIGFVANPTANITSFNIIRVCSGEGIFQGGNLFEENVQVNVWGIARVGNIPE